MNTEPNHSHYTRNEKVAAGAAVITALVLGVVGIIAADGINKDPMPTHRVEVDINPTTTSTTITLEK